LSKMSELCIQLRERLVDTDREPLVDTDIK
jgi:hypothetical protein